MIEFRAELETSGGTAAGFEVPQAVVDELAGGGHPKVVVRVNAKAFFDSLPYSKQQRHTLQVSGARQPDTRTRRVAASVAMLRSGRAR